MLIKIILGILIFVILLILLIFIVNKYNKYNEYNEVINVSNIEDLAKHFVLDNPNEDGTDPTGGLVDYEYMFKRDSKGIIKNINNDISWQNIDKDTPLLKNIPGGFEVHIDNKLLPNGNIGAPRLMSRKLYKGGLFIFDVEHIPVGCALWPAVWLNGFIGVKDQYHEKEGTDLYKKSIKKLAKSTTENFPGTCSGKNTSLLYNNKVNINDNEYSWKIGKDPHLSKYLNKDIYTARWPSGGEIDIIEQTNFSKTNLMSIHSGPLCEVSNGYENNYMVTDKELSKSAPEYVKAQVRSSCGQTASSLGPYSGCKDNSHKINGEKTKLPDGSSRFNCPKVSTDRAGNSQVTGPDGSFGVDFNTSGGGVYVLEWNPKEILNIWWFTRKIYSKEFLEKNNGPLSKNPKPTSWKPKLKGDLQNYDNKVLVASYILNNKNALTKGCDLNYQGIIINITLGGGWGGNVMPKYCSVNQSNDWTNYIRNCIGADPTNATKNGGVDLVTNCYDGAMAVENRGISSKPIFYKEAFFKFRNIRVLQKNGDDNVW